MNSLCKTLLTIVAIIAMVAMIIVVVFGLCLFSKSSSDTIELPNVVLSLIGVCATIIVGVSVYNTVEVNSVLRKTEGKTEELEKKLKELSTIADDVEKLRAQANILFHLTWGMVLKENQPYTALREFWSGFEHCVKSDDYIRGRVCLKEAIKIAKSIASKKETIKMTDKEKIPHEFPVELEDTKLYRFYRSEVDKLFEKIKEIV